MASGKTHLKHCIAGLAAALMLVSSAFAGQAEEHAKAVQMWEVGNVPGAMALWKKIAEEGYAPSQVSLADMLDQSEFDEDAVAWYQKAADQGDAAGEYGLGVMYAKGEGTKQDLAKAAMYITRAAEQNYPNALTTLAESYKIGALGLPVDLEKSAMWDVKAKEFQPKEDPKAAKKNDKKRRK